MNRTACLPLFRPTDTPFVLIKNARLTFDSQQLPVISEDQINNGRALAVKGQYREFTDSSTFSIVIRDYMFRHYFHFMETLLTLYAVHREMFPGAYPESLYFGNFVWNNPKQNNIQREILSLLYPTTDIITRATSGPLIIENLLYIDRRLSHNPVNKMIEPALMLICKHALTLRREIFERLAIDELSKPDDSRPLKILYVPRHPPRALSKEIEADLLKMLSSIGSVEIIDFATLCWKDQVQAAASHDMMVGVHGNGLTNLLWLPRHAMALELFPVFAHQYDYQMLAEVMGRDYFGIEGRRVFRPFIRHGWPYAGGPNPVTRLMVEEIGIALTSFVLRLTQCERAI